mmetsp:Transcript_15743/g.13158  ORF Transcript_15743/g.13158 Transcript_15743/m.13158 type:complete len:91 (-) Transcript_15743:343-615(-)
MRNHHEGKTLFIRNLPFNCIIPDVVTELTEQLKADGEENVKQPIVFVKFVGGGEHPSSGKAFVKMRSRELADRLLTFLSFFLGKRSSVNT